MEKQVDRGDRGNDKIADSIKTDPARFVGASKVIEHRLDVWDTRFD